MAVKTVLLVIAIAFLVTVAVPVSFAERKSSGSPAPRAKAIANAKDDKGDAMRKLGRGLLNCLTFPLELPKQISKTNSSDGLIAAFTYGFVKGLVMGMFRAVAGAYEVATFPIPLPEYYKPILRDPEFMLGGWNT